MEVSHPLEPYGAALQLWSILQRLLQPMAELLAEEKSVARQTRLAETDLVAVVATKHWWPALQVSLSVLEGGTTLREAIPIARSRKRQRASAFADTPTRTRTNNNLMPSDRWHHLKMKPTCSGLVYACVY